MLDDISGVSKIFLITGRTDMRKSFDGLMAIIRNIYQLDPYANAVYLFCGRDSRKIKALYFDKTGFLTFVKNRDFINFYFCFRSKTMGIYPPSSSCGFWICGCSHSRYGSDFLSVDNFPKKKQSGMIFTAFCLFQESYPPS